MATILISSSRRIHNIDQISLIEMVGSCCWLDQRRSGLGLGLVRVMLGAVRGFSSAVCSVDVEVRSEELLPVT